MKKVEVDASSAITISDLNLKMFENLIASEAVSEPLQTQFFIDLLRLEEKYYNKDFSMDSLNELISHYAKCVEYYDNQKDPIKYYFLEKIQATLASRGSLRLLINKLRSSAVGPLDRSSNVRGTTYKSMNYSEAMTLSLSRSFEEFKFGEEEDEEELRKENNRKTLAKSKASGNPDRVSVRYSISKKKIERAKKITMYMQMEQKRQELKDINSILTSYENQIARNDSVVSQHLNAQMQILQAKIVKRNINCSQNREPSNYNRKPSSSFGVMRYLSEVDNATRLEYLNYISESTLYHAPKNDEKSADEGNPDFKRSGDSERENDWVYNKTELSSDGNMEEMIATPRDRKAYSTKLEVEVEAEGTAENAADANPIDEGDDDDPNN